MRKKGKIFVKTFYLEYTLYIWKYFVLNIQADSYRPPNCFGLLRLWVIIIINYTHFSIEWNLQTSSSSFFKFARMSVRVAAVGS